MNQSQLESVRAARLQLIDLGDEKTAKLLDWALGEQPAAARAVTLSAHQLRVDLLKAAINCPHKITAEAIVLRFDESKPGRNALNQLGLRLEDAGKES